MLRNSAKNLKSTRLSGKTKIILDIFLCICVAITVIRTTKKETQPSQVSLFPTTQQLDQHYESFTGKKCANKNSGSAIFDNIFSFFCSILSYFFLLFFWSWKKDHVECSFARWSIHILCWIWFFLAFIILGLTVYNIPKILSGYIGWYVLFFIVALTAFITEKYSKLMCPENPKFYIINSIQYMIVNVFNLAKNLTRIGLEKYQTTKHPIKYFIIITLLYLILYPLLNHLLNLNEEITTIPLLIIFALLNKTVWLYIFLFWFAWNLFYHLKALNNTWIKSLEKNNKGS